jgi:DNA invertase Pin-like site-specific DNA recombinase
MRRAYSYKRFSSPKQARGDSIRRQTEFEQRVIEMMGLVFDDSIDLTDRGVSGYRGDSAKFGALAEFLRRVESGRIPKGSVLLVENIDRLSRENVLDAFHLFSGIIRSGITIVTANDEGVYDRESVAADFSRLMVTYRPRTR